MQRNGTSTSVTVTMEEKQLTDDISLFDELENRSLKNSSSDLGKMCPDPKDNRRLSELQRMTDTLNEYSKLINWLPNLFSRFM